MFDFTTKTCIDSTTDPAAPDIPGIPPGTAEDAANYVTFFTKLTNRWSSSLPSRSTQLLLPSRFSLNRPTW